MKRVYIGKARGVDYYEIGNDKRSWNTTGGFPFDNLIIDIDIKIF